VHSSAEVRLVAAPYVPGGQGVPAAEPLGQYAPMVQAVRGTRGVARVRAAELISEVIEQRGSSYYMRRTLRGVRRRGAHRARRASAYANGAELRLNLGPTHGPRRARKRVVLVV